MVIDLAEQEGPEKPWHFEADRIAGQHDSEIVEAWGDVRLRQGNNILRADYARYYRTTRWVLLRGSVEVNWQGDEMRAAEAEFDLSNQVGWLKDGLVFIEGPHLYFEGDFIRKHWGDTYSFRNARVTACDGEVPDWSIAADEGEITLDGYARLWSAAFKVRDDSVFSLPFVALPVKFRRQSGFLTPSVGLSSNLGFNVDVPYYWAIDEGSDATFNLNAMSARGVMLGAEYRVNRSMDTKGYWRAEWLYDAVIADTEGDEPDPLDDDGLVRDNPHRFWLRGKYDTALGDPDWKVKMDVDWVSDQNYLREFQEGTYGFTAQRDMFLQEFGRDINEIDQERTSTLLVSRDWDRWGLSARMEWNQDPEFGHGNLSHSLDPSLQKLPELTAYVWKDRLPWAGDMPVEFEGEAQASWFYRREGTRGGRLDIFPRLSFPFTSAVGSVIPSIGWHQTFYAVERFENQPEDPDGNYSGRGLLDIQATAFTELYNVYDWEEAPEAVEENVGEVAWTKIRHSLQPRVSYHYIPNVKQEKKPLYDELDRIDEKNVVTYGVTNVFSRKRVGVNMQPRRDGGEGEAPGQSSDYADFLRLRVEQSFDFNEAARSEKEDEFERRPFGDLFAELSLRAGRNLQLVNRTWFSPYLLKVTEHEHLLEMDFPSYGRLYFGLDWQEEIHEYRREVDDRLRILKVGGDVYLGKQWLLSAEYRADLDRGIDLSKYFALKYLEQCYDLEFSFTDNSIDRRIELRVNLAGLDF